MSIVGASLLIVILVALACVVAYVMLLIFAEIIGWRALVRRFGYVRNYHGSFEKSKGVLLGRNAWNAPPLRVGFDDEGIVLRPIAPLRGAFGIVRLPWSAVISTERRSFMFFDAMTLRYGVDPGASIVFLSGSVADHIEAHRASATS